VAIPRPQIVRASCTGCPRFAPITTHSISTTGSTTSRAAPHVPDAEHVVANFNEEEFEGDVEDARCADLAPGNLRPDHLHLVKPHAQLAGQLDQLHVKGPPLEALLGDDVLRGLPRHQLKAALRVPDLIPHDHRHQRVKAVHQKVANGRPVNRGEWGRAVRDISI